ncbi:hypothetical protein DM02DRAFT_734490 [Periconia macrospinosa]|uniref:Uncharacterized protein n=1 Tax=Periconia macrospinosa TaxID=97972 RepID=A0A2V1CY38_9PLEO|nr:hypothetical protein DM02DRAFT_734490 [Periconia macrospinosa]
MFKKLKDQVKERSLTGTAGDHLQSQFQSNNPYHPTNYTPSQAQQADTNETYQPPSGPLPSHNNASSSSGYGASEAYQPPPGPPPGHSTSSNFPSQPPPSWEPPPYHDWTVIPDIALLPPPPSIGYDSSPTANSTMEEGDRAFAWTQSHPLWSPQAITPQIHEVMLNGNLALLKPPTYTGDLTPQRQNGHWKCRTQAKCPDSCILTNLPTYSANLDSPLRTQRPKTIYFRKHGAE